MSVGKNGRTLVVMPTLNERLLFEGVMQGIAALDIDKDSLHVLLVDDDSQDQTWRNYGTHWAAEDARFYLMRRTGRFKGQGSALKDAIGWAVDHENQYEYLAVIAGNQTDDPAFLPAMIGKLEAGADVVVAQRSEQPGGEAGLGRRLEPDEVEGGHRHRPRRRSGGTGHVAPGEDEHRRAGQAPTLGQQSGLQDGRQRVVGHGHAVVGPHRLGGHVLGQLVVVQDAAGGEQLVVAGARRVHHQHEQDAQHQADQGVKLELLARAKRAGLRLDTVDVPLIPRGPQCEFRGGTTGFVGAKLLWIKRTLGLL